MTSTVTSTDLTTYVPRLSARVRQTETPMSDVHQGGQYRGQQPKPHEQEYLLVEKIDGQYALYRVTVYVCLLSYLV